MPKNNTGKKFLVLRDELNITGGGVYCLMPFDALDNQKKAIFKIGMAIDFNKRMESYHTYFPEGVYYNAFLENPPVRATTRGNPKEETKKMKYTKIEKDIVKHIIDNGGKLIYSSTRSKNPNEQKEGATEWIYTNENTIHQAFSWAQKKYNGKVHLFYLEGVNPDTLKFESIVDKAKEKENDKPLYTGKIMFHR